MTVFVGACSDDSPTGNNQLDPTLTTTPCDSAYNPVVGTNGFIMSGTGFQGQLVKFVEFTRDVRYDFYDSTEAAITYLIQDTLDLSGDPTTQIMVDWHFPKSAVGVYPFNSLVGDSATTFRLEFHQDVVGRKVYRSMPGQGSITLDTVIGGAQYIGRFCGMLQDTSSRAQIAIMAGRFSVSQ